FAGIGNIAATVIADGATRGLPSHNGIAGQTARRIQEFSVPWPPGAVLVAHTDGVGSHWKLAAYPGLERKHPAVIAGVLYHEFRTPLKSIDSLAQLLLNGAEGPVTDGQRTALHLVRKSALELAQMVDELLELAKIDAGKVSLRISDCEVGELLGGLRAVLRP